MGPVQGDRGGSEAGGHAAPPRAVALVGVTGGWIPISALGATGGGTEVRGGGRQHRPLSSRRRADRPGAAADGHRRPHRAHRVVTPAGPRGPAALASSGALAVDMESAWLADQLADRPLAVVRAVADTADQRDGAGRHAGPRPPCAAAPLTGAWAGALGRHEVVLAAPRSFCAGVERAIDIVERALDRFGAPVYVRRQIVHNTHVVDDLEGKGAVFVEELDEVPEGAMVVLAAHGVSPKVRAEAARRSDLSVIDATCPLVAKVHHEARRFAAQDYQSSSSATATTRRSSARWARHPGSLVERPEDVATLDIDPEPGGLPDPDHAGHRRDGRVVDALRDRFPDLHGPSSDDICYATQNRQDAVAGMVGLMRPDAGGRLGQLVQHGPAGRGGPARGVPGPTDRRRRRSSGLGWLDGCAPSASPPVRLRPKSLVQRGGRRPRTSVRWRSSSIGPRMKRPSSLYPRQVR